MLIIEKNSRGAVFVKEDDKAITLAAHLEISMWPTVDITQLGFGGVYQPERVLAVGEKASYTVAGDYKITIERVAQSEKVIKLRKRS